MHAAIESAHLHATAHGIYEAFLNGTRVGDCELTPGFTAYRKRLQVQTFDVTDLLKEGRNALGAILSDGWWRGQNGMARRVNDYGATTAFLAELVVTLRTGEVVRFGTDSTWRSRASHILRADLMAGEVHDLRLRVTGWAEPGIDRSSWDVVRVADYGFAELCVSPAPPVRRIEELRPVSIRELAPQRWVVDFGQNSNGWVRLRRLGPAGTQIHLTYGEALDRDGDVTQANVASGASIAWRRPGYLSGGHSDLGRDRRRCIRAPPQHQRIPVRAPRRLPGSTRARRHRQHRGAHRPPPRRVVCLFGRSCQRPPPDRRLELSRQRLRHSHRLSDARASGVDRRLADLRRNCRLPVRRPRLLDKWLRDLAAEQWPNGAVTNLVPEPHPMDDREPPYWKNHGRLGGLGRCGRARAVGDLPCHR